MVTVECMRFVYSVWKCFFESQINILIALRDIRKGEEICRSYVGFGLITKMVTPEFTRRILRDVWGIVCDKNCVCYDKAYYEKIKLGWELRLSMVRFESAETVNEVFVEGNKCVELENQLKLLAVNVRRTLKDGYQINVSEMSSRTLLIVAIESEKQLRNHPEYNEQVKELFTPPYSFWRVRVIPDRTPSNN